MYHSEAEANANGFRFYAPPASGSIRHAHRIAYPVACRFGYKAALAFSVAALVLVRLA